MKYEFRIKGEQVVRFEADTMLSVLRQVAMHYYDWWFVYERGDAGDLLQEAMYEPDAAFRQRLIRCANHIKQGYAVLFGDKSCKFKPEQLKTLDDVERILAKGLKYKSERDFEIVEVE